VPTYVIGRNARVAFAGAVFAPRCAAYSLDHAAELDEDAVAGALEAPIVQGDGRINPIATRRAEPRQCAILVHAGKSAVTDHVGGAEFRTWPLADEIYPAIPSPGREKPKRDGEFRPAEISLGYHVLNRAFRTRPLADEIYPAIPSPGGAVSGAKTSSASSF
jgi:hypothetical protein